ncbi:MAG: hypothetical protein KGN78_12745 [Actinomycetales bacterium]|nr:hypothetical protein [Actinomycetales bacterium]
MDSRTWQQPQPRGSVYAEKTTWLLVAAFALLLAGLMVNQSTTAFFTDTRVVSGNNFITASVALNETPFTAFNFEKFVPGDVFVRPVQVTNSTASNSGAINVNYFMTVRDNFTNCSTQDPKCTDAKGTLSDPVNGLRLVAIRCFSDAIGTENVACESSSLRSVRLIKGVMETIWPGGAAAAGTDIAGVVRDRNQTVQYGNVGGTGSEQISAFPGLPNGGDASDYFGRPIVFARAGALSTQPISVKINPRRNDTSNSQVLGAATLTNTSTPVVQGSDVLRIGGTIQDLDGNWRKAVISSGGTLVGSSNASDDCSGIKISKLTGADTTIGIPNAVGCGAEVVGVPIQTLSNPNCNGVATSAANRAVANATGGQGSQAGPAANAQVGVATAVANASGGPGQTQIFSTQSQGACFMGGSEFEKNAPIVLSPRINNQLMAAGGGETPRIVSDIPAQSLFDQVNTIAGLGAGKSDNLALIVYLPSWATQSTQDETGTTALTVQSRQTQDAQNNPVAVPIGGAGNKSGGKASYTVAFTAVQPVGQTFALANVAQQSVNTLAALAGQIQTNTTAFQAQSSDVGAAGANLIVGGIQTVSPNQVAGGGRQIVSVTGRGFAKVTAIPQNVKVETSDSGGNLDKGKTYKYIVTAGTDPTPSGPTTWQQGEPSAPVSVTVPGSLAGNTSTNTITWALVPGATHYNVYKYVDGTLTKRISVTYGNATTSGTAAYSTVPAETGFVAGSIVGVLDKGGANNLSDITMFPSVGRPCVAYAPVASIGMCPKIEVMTSGAIPVPATVTLPQIKKDKAYEIATLGDATEADWAAVGATAKVGLRFVATADATGSQTATVVDLFPGTIVSGGTDWPKEVESAKLSATQFLVRSGEVLKGSGTPRSAAASYTFTAPSATALLETDSGLTTDASSHVLAQTSNTAGFLSTNQVTFEALSPIVTGTPKSFGVRVTNPSHDSLPLDVRSKVLTFADAMTVIPQTISGYTPGSIGRISTGNTLVIKGLGFQKGAIVQLGVLQKTKAAHADATLSDRLGCTVTSPTWSCDASASAKGLLDADSNIFVSKSHILNRDANTLKKLGTWYQAGYKDEITSNLTAGTIGLESTGLVSKDLPAAAGSAVPFFSYDHNSVEVNTDKQITIKGITVTSVADAPTTAAAKVYNPDGTVAYATLFNIAAPGIEQIVQVDKSSKNWLSAAQGQTVTLNFKSSTAGTFQKTASGLPPKVAVSCYALATTADVTRGVKHLITGSAAAEGQPFDPCKDLGTSAIDTGVTQIGDLSVSSDGKTVAGTFAVAANAKVALRKFTMTNGDAAVFNNYFSISKAPTFAQISYPSGTSRMHDDVKAELSDVSSGSGALTGLVGLASNATNLGTTKSFNVVGKLPRATTRRVLITGSAFVRGSFAPMPDPLVGSSSAATSGTGSECEKCFGKRSGDTLVSAEHAATTTPRITFNTPGVKLKGDSTNTGVSNYTTVVKDSGANLDMSTKVMTSTAQSTDKEDEYIATQRLTAIIEVDTTAPAGPVTMTITNPDGGQVIVPSAFMIDGAPTINTTLDAVYSVGADKAVVNTPSSSVKQGQIKTAGNAIFIYGSGFFATYKADGSIDQAPQVSISGTGVRVTSVRLSNINPGTAYSASDASMPDTVLRVELAAESTAPTGNRSITVVLPDGQSVTYDGELTAGVMTKPAFVVNAP